MRALPHLLVGHACAVFLTTLCGYLDFQHCRVSFLDARVVCLLERVLLVHSAVIRCRDQLIDGVHLFLRGALDLVEERLRIVP